MNISDKKRNELYNASAVRIMDLRVELKMDHKLREDEALDARLFKLELQIWNDIKTTLNI